MRLHAAREQTQARNSNPNGSEDGLAKAIEIVVTPAIFALVGFGLDRWLGTGPWLAISFGIVAFVLKLLVEWYRYAQRMQSHEEELASSRPSQRRGLDRTAEDSAPVSLPAGVLLESAEALPSQRDESDQMASVEEPGAPSPVTNPQNS